MTDETNVVVGDEIVAIREAFEVAIAASKDEDDTKMDMIGAGAKFKNVTRFFNQFMIESGYKKSKEEKEEILNKVLVDVDLADSDNFDSRVADLMEALEANEKSASASLRQWCKKNDIEFFKKPKSDVIGRPGITAEIYEWITANPFGTDEGLTAAIIEAGTEKTIKNKIAYAAVLKLARDVATIYSSDEKLAA